MKRFVFLVFGLHFVLATLCTVPTSHADANGLHSEGGQSIVSAVASDDCHACDDMDHPTSHHDSPCAGGQCISQEAVTISPPILLVGAMPTASIFSRLTSFLTVQERESHAPLIAFATKTTVLRL